MGLHLSAETGHDHDGEHDHDEMSTTTSTSSRGAYLYVTDADALYDEWARPGTGGQTGRVGDTPYRLREGAHTDPDGNLIRFGSPIQPAGRAAAVAPETAVSGVRAETMTDLDVGVWRVGRADGPDWVARWFAPRRPAAAAGDGEILRYLAEHDFPAERVADAPVSVLGGRPVLVTEWASRCRAGSGVRRSAPRADSAASARCSAGCMPSRPVPGPSPAGRRLASPGRRTAVGRDRGGGWLLAAAAQPVRRRGGAAVAALRAEVDALDAAEGLPEALTHPDFVLANVVATGPGLVLVDWAGTGRGPRVWSLAFLLYAEGAGRTCAGVGCRAGRVPPPRGADRRGAGPARGHHRGPAAGAHRLVG